MKKYLLGVAVVATVVGLSGCMGTSVSMPMMQIKTEKFAKFMEKYQGLNGKKAIAVAKEHRGGHVYGYAYERSSQEEANSVALEEGNKRKSEVALTKSNFLLVSA